MYKFSYVKDFASKAEIVTKETFWKILRDQRVKDICFRIAEMPENDTEEIGKLKRQLPAYCWHAWFDNGKRKNYTAHASGLIMLDLDHLDNPPQTWGKIDEKAKANGLLVAHVTPSGSGLRLVFPIPKGMNISKAQTYYAKLLNLRNLDTCTKDLARLSFAVPEEFFLYLNEEELFEGEEYHPDVEVEIAEAADAEVVDNKENIVYDVEYNGIPYPNIVEKLETLMGGKPTHGSRNNFIFSMSCYLRYICNDDPDWIAQILPNYGENEDKWMATIKSACSRAQSKTMPQIMRRALDMARQEQLAQNVSNEEEGSEQLPPSLPKKLPKLIAHLIKNVPEVCRPSVACGVFPSLATHLHGVKFQLIDGTLKEATFMCVNMAPMSSGKSAVNTPIQYIIKDILERDEQSRRREQEWKEISATKSANKEKPRRPDDLCVQILVSDMTNAAFVQRMTDAKGRYIYTNLEELQLLDQLQTNGKQDIGKIICLCFDNGIYGQERVGTQSVTAKVPLRWNWNASSTIQKAREFFKNRLVDGTLSRINFCTIFPDKSKPFIYGRYDEEYAEVLKPFINNLNIADGIIECPEALSLASKLLEKCEEVAALTDDETFLNLAYRAVTIAFLKGMLLYIAHGRKWSDEIADFTQWSLDYDMWCKMHFFGEKIKEHTELERVKKTRGRKNLLELLPCSFTSEDAVAVRKQQGMSENPRQMLNLWVFRGYVERDDMGRYCKTDSYLKRNNNNFNNIKQ